MATCRIIACICVVTAMLAFSVQEVLGEELEPKAYSAAPIGTNFLVFGYSNSTGGVGFDATLPISNVHASVNVGTVAFSHTFNLGGHMASVAIQQPYAMIDAGGQVYTQNKQVWRSGLANLRARFAINFLGCPALSPAAFAKRKPTTTFGFSLAVLSPVGTYNPAYLINTSTNRWSFKPELGVEQPIANWFVDASAGYWLFSTNPNFFNGQVLTQDPLSDFQLHTGYNFHRGLWVAADVDYYTGGATSLNGVAGVNRLANSRYGFTGSYPIGQGFSTKLAWSHWLSGRYGQNFNTVAVALQYRWFDQ